MSTVTSFSRAAAVVLCLSGLVGAIAVQAADKTAVVMQVSENNPAIWNLALNNAKNIQEELGKDNVDIEIVAYGPGISMLKFDSEVTQRMKEASDNGVALVACGNTMKKQKLTEKDMDSHVKVVKAGVVEIMSKQKSGWTYIKP